MDVGAIEATLTAKFDSTPFDRFDKAFGKADRDSKNPIIAKLDGKLDSSGFSRFDKEYDQAKRDAAKGITTHLKADADTSGFRQYRDAQGRLREENGRYAKSNTDVQNSTRKTGAGFSALAGNAKMLGGAAAIGGLAIAFRSMVAEQSEAQAVNAQVDAALKSMGGAANISAKQIDELSTSLSKKSGVDDETIKSGAALMLTFGKVRNEAGKGNDIFTQSIGLSGDLSRAFGKDLHGSSIMLGKALNDPIKGITALGRVGVQFTAQQKDQIKTMVESGDTMGAQKLILANLEKQVGGSAEAYGKTLPGAIDRAKVSFGNLMENLGGKVAPAVSAIADVLGGLFEGKKLKGGIGGFLNPIIDGVKAAWPPIKAAFTEISKAFGDVFGSGKDAKKFGKDMEDWGGALGAVIKFAADAFKDAAPTIRFILKYLLMGIREFTEFQVKLGRDVVKMANWIGNAWDNVSRWVGNAIKNVTGFLRGAVSAISGVARRIGNGISDGFDAVAAIPGKVSRWIRNAVANVGSFASDAARRAATIGRNILNGVGDFVSDLPRKVSGFIGRAIDGLGNLAGRALSAGASVGRAVINGIGNGLSGLGSFLGNVGRGIANWINANTPFGDSIKVGPVSVRLPALAMGGKVGPSIKGAQFFMAGEGGKDEWVISQEGDRSKNIGWAKDALEKLTGKKIAMHKGGGLIAKALGPKLKKSVGKLGNYAAYPKQQGDKIDRLETQYGQQSRIFDITDEQFLTSNDDGSVTVNTKAIDDRLSDLTKLEKLRTDLKAAIGDLNKWITSTAKTLAAAIKKLKSAANRAKKKDRKVYTNEIKKMSEARGEMLGLQPDLTSAAEDSRIDLLELAAEKADVASMKDQGKAATPPPPPEPPAPGDPSTPDTPAPAPPSPEEIAQAAAAQFASFTANRASLFGSFGQNFIGAGGQLTASSAAAGFRMFGAGQTDGGGVFGSAGGSGFADLTGGGFGSAQRAGAGGVIITNNYAAPPPDPHTWSQGLAWEIRTAV